MDHVNVNVSLSQYMESCKIRDREGRNLEDNNYTIIAR